MQKEIKFELLQSKFNKPECCSVRARGEQPRLASGAAEGDGAAVEVAALEPGCHDLGRGLRLGQAGAQQQLLARRSTEGSLYGVHFR